MSKIDQQTEPNNQKKEFKKLTKWCLGVYGLAIGAFMAMGWWLTTYTQLLESASESLEGIHYILVYKSASIKRGDIVLIQGHTPQYVGEKPFTKRVIGLAGDRITRGKKGLEIKARNSSVSTIFPLLKKTKEGQALTALPIQIVPEGTLFVVGDHPRSFDSRYEEFGLVPVEKVWGKAVLSW